MKIQTLVLATTLAMASSSALAASSSLLKDNVIQRLSQAKAERYATMREESEQLEIIEDALTLLAATRSRLEAQTIEYKKVEGEIWIIKRFGRIKPETIDQTRLNELETRLPELEKSLRQPLTELIKVEEEMGALQAKADQLERKLDAFTADTSRLSEVEFYSFIPQQFGKCKFKRIDGETLSVNVEGKEIQVKLDAQRMRGKSVTSLGSNHLIIQSRSADNNTTTTNVSMTYDADSDRIISLFVLGTPWSKLGLGKMAEWPDLYSCSPHF